jgi:hypothetical protein
MKKGDVVRGYDGWLARVAGVSKNIRIIWQTGPLKGRDALVPKEHIKVVAKGERNG